MANITKLDSQTARDLAASIHALGDKLPGGLTVVAKSTVASGVVADEFVTIYTVEVTARKPGTRHVASRFLTESAAPEGVIAGLVKQIKAEIKAAKAAAKFRPER